MEKGQIAFEALLLTLAVLSATIFVTALYLQTSQVTLTTAAARDNLAQQLNDTNTTIQLSSVTAQKQIDGNILLIIKTTPQTLRATDINLSALQTHVQAAAPGTKIKIQVN